MLVTLDFVGLFAGFAELLVVGSRIVMQLMLLVRSTDLCLLNLTIDPPETNYS